MIIVNWIGPLCCEMDRQIVHPLLRLPMAISIIWISRLSYVAKPIKGFTKRLVRPRIIEGSCRKATCCIFCFQGEPVGVESGVCSMVNHRRLVPVERWLLYLQPDGCASMRGFWAFM